MLLLGRSERHEGNVAPFLQVYEQIRVARGVGPLASFCLIWSLVPLRRFV